MTKSHKKWHRWISLVMALVLLLNVPFTKPASAAEFLVSDPLPDDMANSHILASLEYLGYNAQWFRDHNLLFEIGNTPLYFNGGVYLYPDFVPGENEHYIQYPSDMQNEIFTDIDYNNIHFGSEYGFSMGTETVPSNYTVTGYAPDIATFAAKGWPCLSYPNYYWFNYLSI